MSIRQSMQYFWRGLCPFFSGKFNYYGTRTYFPAGSSIFQRVCVESIYEQETTEWLCRIAQPNKLFIDVGANIGLTSIPVLRSVRTARVLSFEPSPGSISFLNQTWQASSFRERWEIVPKAVGDSVGITRFFVSSSQNALFDGLCDTKRGGQKREVEVALTTIDQEWHRLGCPLVGSVKIDVEGAEIKVLAGAEAVIRRDMPHLLLEWQRENLEASGVDVQSILDFAISHDYKLMPIPTLNPITDLDALEFHMLHTESFLLSPARKRAKG